MGKSQIRQDPTSSLADSGRETRLRAALFHGAGLTLENSAYFQMLRTLTEQLLRVDREPQDLTCAALGIAEGRAQGTIIANDSGVLAGLDEACWFYSHFGLKAERRASDGQEIQAGQELLHVQGDAVLLLSLERIGLNLLQRLCGIATATHRLAKVARSRSPHTHVIATRKTPWGLLDKRAAHLGGGGTHRLGLGDAILIKSNHLLLFGPYEAQAVPLALTRAWADRERAAFVEVEVTSLEGALAAARTFRGLQASDTKSNSYPCLIMLDNKSPGEVARIIAALRAEGLWDNVLIEVSGGISEDSLGAFADCGVDAISIGALTHSCRALDLRCKLESWITEDARATRIDA